MIFSKMLREFVLCKAANTDRKNKKYRSSTLFHPFYSVMDKANVYYYVDQIYQNLK